LLSCEAVSDELALVVDGSRRPSAAMAEHLRTCLFCQAELAGYKRLLRILRSLKEEEVIFPAAQPGLAAQTLRELQSRLRVDPRPNPQARARAKVRVGAVVALGVLALGAGALLARSSRLAHSLVNAPA
jgi:hypothetical protein